MMLCGQVTKCPGKFREGGLYLFAVRSMCVYLRRRFFGNQPTGIEYEAICRIHSFDRPQLAWRQPRGFVVAAISRAQLLGSFGSRQTAGRIGSGHEPTLENLRATGRVVALRVGRENLFDGV